MVRVHRGSPFFRGMQEVTEMTEKKIKINYAGSRGWLIFWIIVLFPIAPGVDCNFGSICSRW